MDDKTAAAAASGTASNDAAEASASADGMRSLLAAAMGLTRLHDGPASGGAGEEATPTPTAKANEKAPSKVDAEEAKPTEASAGPTPKPPAQQPALDPTEPLSFPETLHALLSTPKYSSILSWLPHGRTFSIHDRERFAKELMPRYFSTRANPAGGNFGKGAKYTSFTRRLKRWRFDRVNSGLEMGAYYHRLFLRDQPELVGQMVYDGGGSSAGGADKHAETKAPKHGPLPKEKAKGAEGPKAEGEKKMAASKASVSRLPAKKRKQRLADSDEDSAVVAAAAEMRQQQRQIEMQQEFLRSHTAAHLAARAQLMSRGQPAAVGEPAALQGATQGPAMPGQRYLNHPGEPQAMPPGPLDRGYGSMPLEGGSYHSLPSAGSSGDNESKQWFVCDRCKTKAFVSKGELLEHERTCGARLPHAPEGPKSVPTAHGLAPLDRGYGGVSLPGRAMGYGAPTYRTNVLRDRRLDEIEAHLDRPTDARGQRLHDVRVYGDEVPAHLRAMLQSKQEMERIASLPSSGRGLGDREQQLQRAKQWAMDQQQLLLRDQRERRLAELGAAEMAAARRTTYGIGSNERARSLSDAELAMSLSDAEFNRQYLERMIRENQMMSETELRAGLYGRGSTAAGYPQRNTTDGTTSLAATGVRGLAPGESKSTSYRASLEGIAPIDREEMKRRVMADRRIQEEMKAMSTPNSNRDTQAPSMQMQHHHQQRMGRDRMSEEELLNLATRVGYRPQRQTQPSNQPSALSLAPETRQNQPLPQQPQALELEEKVEQEQTGGGGKLDEKVEQKRSEGAVANQGLRDSLDGEESDGLVRRNSRASAA